MNLFAVVSIEGGPAIGTASLRLELENSPQEAIVNFVNSDLRAEHESVVSILEQTPEFPTEELIREYRRSLEGDMSPEEIEQTLETYATERIRPATISPFVELTWSDVYKRFHVDNLGEVVAVGNNGIPRANKHTLFYNWYMEGLRFVIVS